MLPSVVFCTLNPLERGDRSIAAAHEWLDHSSVPSIGRMLKQPPTRRSHRRDPGQKNLVPIGSVKVAVEGDLGRGGVFRPNGHSGMRRISFSIYLLHAVVVDYLPLHGFTPALQFLTVGGIVIVASSLTYRWIEKPFILMSKTMAPYMTDRRCPRRRSAPGRARRFRRHRAGASNITTPCAVVIAPSCRLLPDIASGPVGVIAPVMPPSEVTPAAVVLLVCVGMISSG